MANKIKTCVFISGNGTNLESIIKSSRDYSFPVKIELVISNNSKAKGLCFAKKYGIPYRFFPYNDTKKFERNCLYEIKKKKNQTFMFGRLRKNIVKEFYKKLYLQNYQHSSFFVAKI